MVDLLYTLLAFAAGYLLGSANAAVIVGRFYGTDIRRVGSKSAGLTNALRVLGKGAAGLVLAGDVLKGVLACLFGLWLGIYVSVGGAAVGDAVDCVSLLAAGAGAVIGHNWPIYFRFQGGKGILTGVTVLFMADWRIALICLALFVALVAATRYVSLASISAAALFAILSFVPVFGHTPWFAVFACALAAIVIAKHRTNIQRLRSGTENKLAF